MFKQIPVGSDIELEKDGSKAIAEVNVYTEIASCTCTCILYNLELHKPRKICALGGWRHFLLST